MTSTAVIACMTSVNCDISMCFVVTKKVQVGKDQEKAQSAKYSHSKKPEVGKNQTNNQVATP